MATDTKIEIPGNTSRLNSKIRSVIDRLNGVYDDLADIKEAMAQSAADGSAKLASDWGFTGTNGEANASAVQALIASAHTDLAASGAIQQLISRCL